MNETQTLSVPQVARILGVGTASAYNAVRRGEIPSIRIGGRLLVPKPALERMLAGEISAGSPSDK